MTDQPHDTEAWVIQADRDAAQRLLTQIDGRFAADYFGEEAAEAFARHRLAALARSDSARVEHPDDRAVDLFAAKMKAKLAKAREKGRGGWDDPTQCSVEHLQSLFADHVRKGDPIDVANFCMMLDHYDAPTTVGGDVRGKAITALRAYVESAGVPISEFDPDFVVRMMAAMMVSYHKYGRVADAYPAKFDAISDVRARMTKYRETGNRHFLIDAANFAMIEAMHTCRKSGAQWGTNDAADSPGRTTASGHRLVQEANDGSRIMGETILHIPGEDA